MSIDSGLPSCEPRAACILGRDVRGPIERKPLLEAIADLRPEPPWVCRELGPMRVSP